MFVYLPSTSAVWTAAVVAMPVVRLAADATQLRVGLREHARDRQAERGRSRDDGQRDEDEKQSVFRGHHSAFVDEPRLRGVPHGLHPGVCAEEHLSPPFGLPIGGRAVPPCERNRAGEWYVRAIGKPS